MAEPFSQWIGKSVEVADVVTEAPVRRLAAILDHDGAHWPEGVLPPLGHWLFGLPDAPQSALGSDGHPKKGDFFPPVIQPRRMWAGGRLEFIAPIAFGAEFRRTTTIKSIAEKKDSTMTLITLLHEITADGLTAVREEQDLIYLPDGEPVTPQAAQGGECDSSRRLSCDAIMLFRYSALTFNAHRIHYDVDYARNVEAYPGLVVHGPLQATLMIDQALRDGMMPRRFDFRAKAPLYAGEMFTLARRGSDCWIEKTGGGATMTARLA